MFRRELFDTIAQGTENVSRQIEESSAVSEQLAQTEGLAEVAKKLGTMSFELQQLIRHFT